LPPLGFSGTFGPCFQHSPTAFALHVREAVVVSVSFAGLCSAELGFPSLESGEYADRLGGLVNYMANPAQAVFQPPFGRRLPPIPRGGALFMQPVYTSLLANAATRHLPDDPHVRRFSAGMPRGTGQVFRIISDSLDFHGGEFP
jgi:hypothetical protein